MTMKNLILTLCPMIAMLLCGMLVAQATQQRGLWHLEPLTYPTVARLSQITGDVTLMLRIEKDGQINSATKISGPDVLSVNAIKEIRGWRYASSDRASESIVVIHYALKKPYLKSAPIAKTFVHSPTDISVVSNYSLPTGNPEKMIPR
jgi:hypothetical protein